MSNKVTNIYIDTTGFCAEAIERVKKAIGAIAGFDDFDVSLPVPSFPAVGFDNNGQWTYYKIESAKRQKSEKVGLWELESIALQCQQEKKEEVLPTRNIYIDARKLSQKERLNAFRAICKLATGDRVGWAPCVMASGKKDNVAFILFDVFAIDADGDRLFFFGERINDMSHDMGNPKELTYEQLIKLSR